MLTIGQRNTLVVNEVLPMGYLLSSPKLSLHKSVLFEDDKQHNIGDVLNVFVYTNAQGELLATLASPKIDNNQFASLVVTGASEFGYFVDWGIKPDLYVPVSQSHGSLDVGKTYVVKLMTDKQGKLVGTTKIERFLSTSIDSLKPKQAVNIRIYAQTPLGFKAVIDEAYQGLLFKSDLITSVSIGDVLPAFIKHIREDGKIDLSLQLVDEETRLSLESQIIEDLKAHDGMSTLTDKSPAEEIFSYFKVSKGAYKKAIGRLYKEKKIRIEKNCIYLVK